jgi:spermidine/putrescine transport system ATP-binding protein
MSDRLVVMNAGRIEQLGSPRELYERPGTRFVANFIGTSNIVSGRLERRGDGWALAGLGPDERVLVAADAVPPGLEAEIAVRPEKIVLRAETDPPPPGSCALRAKVTEVVYLGTSTQYRTVTDAGPRMAVYRQNAASTPGAEVLVDQVGWLEWSPEHSYVLGAPTKAEEGAEQ